MKAAPSSRSGAETPGAGMSSFEEVNDRLGEHLTAAYVIAIERVWNAIRLRGI